MYNARYRGIVGLLTKKCVLGLFCVSKYVVSYYLLTSRTLVANLNDGDKNLAKLSYNNLKGCRQSHS